MKYVCDVCGWIYDEEDGYPEGASSPAPSGTTSRMILSARSAASARIPSAQNNAQRRRKPKAFPAFFLSARAADADYGI